MRSISMYFFVRLVKEVFSIFKNLIQLELGSHIERNETMKSVYLDYTSTHYEYYVTDHDYQNVIRPLVMKLRVCAGCQQYYDIDAIPARPCVGRRICMECFLKKHSSMQFLEVKSVNDDNEVTYAFIDTEGQVYTSTENYSDEPSKDISYTLSQHQFSLPERYKPFKATEEIRLHSSHFTVYGDLQTASVLVADYNDYYDKHHTAFLLYKNGGYKELTKRGEGKVLIERAMAMLERTKLPNGYFKIDGREVYRLGDGDIYKIVSQMETAMYNISMQFVLPVSQEELGQEPDVAEVQQGDVIVAENEDSEIVGNDTDVPTKSKRGRPRLAIVPNEPEENSPQTEESDPIEEQPAQQEQEEIHEQTETESPT